MSPTQMRLGLLLLAFLFGSLWWWSAWEPENDEPSPIGQSERVLVRESANLEGSAAELESVAEGDAEPIRVNAASVERRTLRFGGTVELQDAEGNPKALDVGQLQFELRCPTKTVRVSTFCENGAFASELIPRANGQYEFVPRPLSSGMAYMKPAERGPVSRLCPESIPRAEIVLTSFSLASQGSVELVAGADQLTFGEDNHLVFRERTPFRLHVTDAETDEPLQRVIVIAARDTARQGDLPFNGDPVHALASEEPSPIEVRPSKLNWVKGARTIQGRRVTLPNEEWNRWFVGAQGYAWQVVEFRGNEEEACFVQLERGGGLQIELEGEAPPLDAEVRLYLDGYPLPVASRRVASSRKFEFQGLSDLIYEVRVERGLPWDGPRVMGSVEAHAQAGHTKTVVVPLHSVPAPVTSSVSGSVSFPDDWELGSFWLSFDALDSEGKGSESHRVIRQDSLRALGSRSSLFAFTIKDLRIGRYVVRVQPLGVAREFELTAGAIEGLRLEVPPPVWLSVIPRDARTGELVALPELKLTREAERDGVLPATRILTWDDAHDCFRAQVVPGEFQLSNTPDWKGTVSDRIRVDADREHVVLVERGL